ncbi:CRISPR-associated helicase Cas3' [Hankyongella ginsenosidimutans]|uniref:CRISPR-associated helicase Cas3 n=1 Tax=Hankyongella ginsenosidimutans TaxID=1763828 RepID=A0A4D7C826_9SPHN|nr:CRISPR-associated helicase Cas3' [Hankyongella ginsenosidimutans]QCI80335.1 CRISPR-associated helicase Cas3' [Hankyongella ginsenosidimutans]
MSPPCDLRERTLEEHKDVVKRVAVLTTPDFIALYWGKARPQAAGPEWHPLAYHALDVAASMAALLDAWPHLLTRIARHAGLSDVVARRWLIAVAALHDLGKGADAFQRKAGDELWMSASLWPAGRSRPQPLGFDHGAFAWPLWEEIKGPEILRLRDEQAQHRFMEWLVCAWSHHGAPIAHQHPILADFVSQSSIEATAAFVTALAKLLALDEAETRLSPPADDNEDGPPPTETWLVAGLCILADWLGSSQRWFPYRAGRRPCRLLGPGAAAGGSRRPAGRAAQRAPAADLAVSTLLPAGAQATPLQQAAADLPLDDGPTLVILEDLTGAGKTEAALLLAHRLMAQGKATGLYWALPTKASANMLFTRLASAYRQLFAPDTHPTLTLAHDAADLHPDFAALTMAQTLAAADDGGYGGDAASASAQACAWLHDDRRKTFLSQIGVGTIDQALLGVLPTRFNSLRLAGLASQLLVIDEVHSFDTYTTELITTLLGFQAALGGSAVLLSATLTRTVKTKLLAAFDAGRRGRTHAVTRAQCDAFPMVSRLDASGVVEQPIASSRGTRRDLAVERLESEQAALDTVIGAARAGLCAVWIRNSVQDAIDAWTRLKARAPDLTPALFHARFTRADRARIETAVVKRFGKASTDDERRGQILVATQVVEQSLDLDFDVMVSDLALRPAGAARRPAAAPRPGPRPAPVLRLLAPDPDVVVDEKWLSSLLPVPDGSIKTMPGCGRASRSPWPG